MYKLRVFIYLNHVPFDSRQKSYEFKSLVNFGTSEKKSKSPKVGRFSKNHAKRNKISYLKSVFLVFFLICGFFFYVGMFFIKS